jgi:hypothetical protein
LREIVLTRQAENKQQKRPSHQKHTDKIQSLKLAELAFGNMSLHLPRQEQRSDTG